MERALQDAKLHSGLGEYQVRGWLGWHHHMAIVLIALLFMLEERVRHGVTVPMLSTADFEKLLKHYLPRRLVCVLEKPGHLILELPRGGRLSSVFHTFHSGDSLGRSPEI